MKLMTFGELLRKTRKQYRLTQTDIAKAGGIATSYVSRIECEERKPTRETVIAIAEALGPDPETTNKFLLCAGYAPIPNEDLIAIRSSSVANTGKNRVGLSTCVEPFTIEVWQEESRDNARTAKRIAEVLVSVLDDDALSAEHKRAMLLVLNAFPTWLQEMKNLAIQSSAGSLEVESISPEPSPRSIEKYKGIQEQNSDNGVILPFRQASNLGEPNENGDSTVNWRGTSGRNYARQDSSHHGHRGNLVAFLKDFQNDFWYRQGDQAPEY
jgi:transcriptional regulator with XRE-family HTH domain